MRHIPALDGVRGIAILMVLAIHTSFGRYPGGILGVDLFFVLSGFLITTLLLREWEARQAISLGHFYLRRALRLVPAMLITVAACAVIDTLMPDTRGSIPYEQAALSVLLYMANWMTVWDPGSLTLLIHTWSLSIEEQFYILWPALLLVLLRKRLPVGRLLGVFGAIALACFGFGAAAALTTDWNLYNNTVPRFGELMIGCLLAVIADRPEGRRRAVLHAIGSREVAGVSLVAILLAGFVIHDSYRWLYFGGLALFALASASVLAHAATQTSPLTAALSWRPLTYVGRISYGLYLYHLPIVIAVSPATLPIDAATAILLRLALTFGLAVLSFHLVETPIRRWGATNRRRELVAGDRAV